MPRCDKSVPQQQQQLAAIFRIRQLESLQNVHHTLREVNCRVYDESIFSPAGENVCVCCVCARARQNA